MSYFNDTITAEGRVESFKGTEVYSNFSQYKMFFTKSVTSGGCCSENNYKYGYAVKILSLLMTISSLILLLIIFCDIGKPQGDFAKEGDTKPEQIENATITLIQVFTLLNFVIQVKVEQSTWRLKI